MQRMLLPVSRPRDPSASTAPGGGGYELLVLLLQPLLPHGGIRNSQEIRPKCRLLDPAVHSATMWFGQTSSVWLVDRSSFSKALVSLVHRQGESCRQFAGRLGVTPAQYLDINIRETAHPWPHLRSANTLEHRLGTSGPSWLQSTPTQMHEKLRRDPLIVQTGFSERREPPYGGNDPEILPFSR